MVSKSKHTLLTLGKHTRLTPSHVVVVLLAPSQRRIADLLGSGPVDGPPLDEETDLLEPPAGRPRSQKIIELHLAASRRMRSRCNTVFTGSSGQSFALPTRSASGAIG